METFLDSSTQSGDNRIKVSGYNLKRPNHPSNLKKDGVFIFYKEHIPLIKLLSHRNSFTRWKMFLTCIYPFQARITMNFKVSKFDTFLNDIYDEFPICSVLTGDFNAPNSWLCKNDITNFSGLELDSLTSSAGYRQITDKPTHTINGIDLIFCTNLNVIFKYDRYFYFW